MTRLDGALQNLLDRTQKRSTAQAVLLHVQSGDDKINFRGAAGAASPTARFPIASITKMYTATLIQQLHDEGQLDLDEKVQRLLPDVDLTDIHTMNGAAYGPRLTVRQLLFQTSGLADYYEGGVAKDVIRGRDQAYDLADVLQMARARAPLAIPDSGKAHYSDTNYQLLGAVIEGVTGKPYAEALEERICRPFGLTNTRVIDTDNDRDLLPLYHKARRLNVPHTLASMGPDGGIISDTADLLRFLRAFMAGRLFNPDAMLRLQEWRPLSFPREYGGGLMRFKLPLWMTLWRPTPELIGHSGASGSFAFHAPERDIFMVGTFNQTDAPRRPFSFMLEVARTIAQHAGVA